MRPPQKNKKRKKSSRASEDSSIQEIHITDKNNGELSKALDKHTSWGYVNVDAHILETDEATKTSYAGSLSTAASSTRTQKMAQITLQKSALI